MLGNVRVCVRCLRVHAYACACVCVCMDVCVCAWMRACVRACVSCNHLAILVDKRKHFVAELAEVVIG